MIGPVFLKSLKEQVRNYWILILTVTLAPFFVFIYYLINEASQSSYDVLLLNQDQGINIENTHVNLGSGFSAFLNENLETHEEMPIFVKGVETREGAEALLKQGQADVLLVLPSNLSELVIGETVQLPDVEMVGNLTSTSYLLAAVIVGDFLNQYLALASDSQLLYTFTETAIGRTGDVSDFDLWMPGIMVLSIIMLMFSATIAIITEVDQKTILRLRLSTVGPGQLLAGIGAVQVLVGLIAILLTLGVAVALGFKLQGSFMAFLLIAFLTSISMIAFSLLLAGFTRSSTDVLIVGNFPLFLFMFFTGAAFPIQPEPWFTLAGYGISWQSLMSPTHAVNALKQISIMGSSLYSVLPELASLISITILYSLLGVWAFNRRHLKQTT